MQKNLLCALVGLLFIAACQTIPQDDSAVVDVLDLSRKAGRYYKIKDYEKAYEYALQAAERGDATSQYNIGVMYYNGHGVAQSYLQALDWFQKAADQGDQQAGELLDLLLVWRAANRDFLPEHQTQITR